MTIRADVRVRCDWCHAEEKGLARGDSVVKKPPGLFGDEIGCMLVAMIHRGVGVALVDWVEVRICAWIEEEVCRSPSGRVRRVVVCCGVRIEELSSIVSIVTCLLKPYGEIIAVQALSNELWISAWKMLSAALVGGDKGSKIYHMVDSHPLHSYYEVVYLSTGRLLRDNISLSW